MSSRMIEAAVQLTNGRRPRSLKVRWARLFSRQTGNYIREESLVSSVLMLVTVRQPRVRQA